MEHETTLEVWKMRDGRHYARRVDRHTGTATWWMLRRLTDSEVIMTKTSDRNGKKLSSEFFGEVRSASQSSLFPE